MIKPHGYNIVSGMTPWTLRMKAYVKILRYFAHPVLYAAASQTGVLAGGIGIFRNIFSKSSGVSRRTDKIKTLPW